jgi:hypothetical protein
MFGPQRVPGQEPQQLDGYTVPVPPTSLGTGSVRRPPAPSYLRCRELRCRGQWHAYSDSMIYQCCMHSHGLGRGVTAETGPPSTR